MSIDGHQSLIYFTDTLEKTLYQAQITRTGELLQSKVFYQFSDLDGYPDGMAIDAQHHIWCCLWSGEKIVRISPEGSIVQQLSLPVSNVTKCAFAMTGPKGLYVTTARKGLSPDRLKQEPLAGSLFFLPTDVGGVPTALFGTVATEHNGK